MAYISSLAVLHFKSSPSPTKKFHCIWIRTFAENSATKKAAAWTGIRLRSPDTTEPNRLESNYKKTHLSFALKKAQTYFLPSFWHGNVHIWHRAYTHFAINLYYLFIKMFKILWWCKHNILYRTTQFAIFTSSNKESVFLFSELFLTLL